MNGESESVLFFEVQVLNNTLRTASDRAKVEELCDAVSKILRADESYYNEAEVIIGLCIATISAFHTFGQIHDPKVIAGLVFEIARSVASEGSPHV